MDKTLRLLIILGAVGIAAAVAAVIALLPSPTPDRTARAKTLYNANCVPCHGADREGVSGLGKPLTPGALAGLTTSELKGIIENGKPGTQMPSWKDSLSGQDIDDLIYFITTVPPGQ